jgi:predicted  nucleic acid-binding Zn-ribbon protein
MDDTFLIPLLQIRVMSPQTTVTTDALRRLHRILQQLQDLQERLERGPRIAKAHEVNVIRLQTELDAAREKSKTLRMATDAKNVQLQGGEAGVVKRKQQLHEAKDNREYQALKEQIAAAEMANSVLADEILEAMERIDAAQEVVKAADQGLNRGKEEAQKAMDAYKQGTTSIHGDIERLQAELKQCEKELPGDFREVYRRLTHSKGSDAMASLHDGFCGGCNQQVPVNLINALMLSRPIQCRSCGRLLYLPEGFDVSQA